MIFNRYVIDYSNELLFYFFVYSVSKYSLLLNSTLVSDCEPAINVSL